MKSFYCEQIPCITAIALLAVVTRPNGDVPIQNLKAGSNADLGLMRSLALVRVLRYIQTKEHRLQGLKFRAYSAAQLILPSGEFAQPSLAHQEDATRRRIEIRFTRLGEVTEVK